MIEMLGKTVLHLLNWIAALFVFSLFFPQYEQIAGFLAFPLAVLALGCTVVIAALSLVSEVS
jgi:hypothetical protein